MRIFKSIFLKIPKADSYSIIIKIILILWRLKKSVIFTNLLLVFFLNKTLSAKQGLKIVLTFCCEGTLFPLKSSFTAIFIRNNFKWIVLFIYRLVSLVMNEELSKNIDIWVIYVLFSDRYTFKMHVPRSPF